MAATYYKILTPHEWESFQELGEFRGTAIDLKDGYIHMSMNSQVEGVIERHFQNIRPLYILKIQSEIVESKVKFEEASNGEQYPHLYDAPIYIQDVVSFETIAE
jgi:uncharacterized protein (DUF952 family)